MIHESKGGYVVWFVPSRAEWCGVVLVFVGVVMKLLRFVSFFTFRRIEDKDRGGEKRLLIREEGDLGKCNYEWLIFSYLGLLLPF